MKLFLIILSIFVIFAASVQAQQPITSLEAQACHSMLFERDQRELNVRKEIFALAEENTKLKVRIKELETKDKPNAEQKP